MRATPFFLFVLLILACGQPAPLGPGGTDTGTNSLTDNPCGPGATGTDTDKDGLTDACECELGMCDQKNVADCDKDGIPDGDDNPADCPADPGVCDAACEAAKSQAQQADQYRNQSRMADGFALGSSAVTGQEFSGINVDDALMYVAFVDSDKKFHLDTYGPFMTDKECTSRDGNFRILVKEVTYSTGLLPPGRKANEPVQTTFEYCGRVENLDPKKPVVEALAVRPVLFGSNEAKLDPRALFGDSIDQEPSTIALELSDVQAIPSSCAGQAAGASLYKKLKTTMEPPKGTAENIYVRDKDGKLVGIAGSLSFDGKKIERTWKRNYGDDAGACSAVRDGFLGATGPWFRSG